MGVEILDIFRLSDNCGHTSSSSNINNKNITFNLLNDIKITEYSSHKGLRRLPKATQNAIAVALKTTENLNEEEKASLGIFVGSSLSYVAHTLQFMSVAYKSSPRLVSPLMFPNTVLNSISGWISIILGSEGINTTINMGNSSGLSAIKLASEYVKLGIIKHALVVVVEEITNAVVESDLYSSNEYTEEAIAMLIGRDQGKGSFEIEDCYSKLTSETDLEKYIEEISKNDEDYIVYSCCKNRNLRLKNYVSLRKKNNLLSCTTINYLYEILKTSRKGIIIFEDNKNIFSCLKIKRKKL